MSKIARTKQNLTSISVLPQSIDEPVILEFTDTGIAVVSGIVTQISYSLQVKRVIQKDQPEKHQESQIEKNIKETIKAIFAVVDLDVLTIPVSILMTNHLTRYDKTIYDKTTVVRSLHKMGYRSKSGRHRYPVISEDLSGYELKYAHTTYYEFHKSDFLS
ncbi:MAG: hypothetical protein IAE95_14280 [Chitinophagaceae bacterium]|nr:hypothetical protein [Chitinophagaceae bacterium]